MGKKEKRSKKAQDTTPPSEGITDSDSEALAVEKRLLKMGADGDFANLGNTTFDGTLKGRSRKSKGKKKRSNSASGTMGDAGEPFAITSYDSGGVPSSCPMSESGTPRKRESRSSSIGLIPPQPPMALTTDGLGSLPPLAQKQQMQSQGMTSLGSSQLRTATSTGPGSAADGSSQGGNGRLPDINRTNHFQYLDSLPAPGNGAVSESGGAGGGRPVLDL